MKKVDGLLKGIYLLGIPVIDRQHKQMIEQYEDFLQALKSTEKNDKKVLKSTAEELLKNAKIHFETEENLLKKISYPDLIAHKTEHDVFKKYFEDIVLEIEYESPYLYDNFNTFLKKWLFSHVMIHDKAYCETVKNIIPPEELE
jgi:hemerythrin